MKKKLQAFCSKRVKSRKKKRFAKNLDSVQFTNQNVMSSNAVDFCGMK